MVDSRDNPNEKIAIIGPYFTSSGTTTHVKRMFQGLWELTNKKTILITYFEPNSVIDKEDLDLQVENGLSFIDDKEKRVYVFSLLKPSSLYGFARFIKDIMIHEHISILHPQIKPMNLLASAIAVKQLLRETSKEAMIIGTWHSNFGWIKDAKYHFALAEMGSEILHAVIPVSKNVYDDIQQYLDYPQERLLRVIPPGGIDLEDVQKPRKEIRTGLLQKYNVNTPYIIFLGRLLHNKGVDVLLEAYRLLLQNTDYSLIIIGKGPMKQEYINKALNVNVTVQDSTKVIKQDKTHQGRIVFTGYITDDEVYSLLQGASVYCLPSRWESFSISTLEAMGAGTPVVCTNVGALPQWVGDAALLVPPDNPETLKNALQTIIENKQVQQTLKERGLQKARQYHWRNLARMTHEEIHKAKNIPKLKPQSTDPLEFTSHEFHKDGTILNKQTKKPMKITDTALFFPSETLENNTYYA